MKSSLLILAFVAAFAVGCTTKSTAKANARAAFYAGQAQALQQQLAATQKPAVAPGNTVAILGPVKVSALTWTPDLTLLKAIVAAEYIPAGEPSQIIVTRNGTPIPINPTMLLNGDDLPLQAGDLVELRQ